MMFPRRRLERRSQASQASRALLAALLLAAGAMCFREAAQGLSSPLATAPAVTSSGPKLSSSSGLQSWNMARRLPGGTIPSRNRHIELGRRELLARKCQAVSVDEKAADLAAERVIGRSKLKCQPIGIGSAAPESRITNSDLEKQVNTSDEWIAQRTGISSRHVLTDDAKLSTLGAKAANSALKDAGISAEDVDLVIVATSSPDDLFGDATSVAHQIGAKNAVAFDLTAACSGFMFAMITAGQYLDTGFAKNAVVVGADALSRWVDWDDRNSCILFGDGAGAVVMKSVSGEDKAGMLGFAMHSDGAKQENLALPYGGTPQKLNSGHSPTKGHYDPITMNGKEVYKFATSEVPRVIKEALGNAGMETSDIDHLLLHQANIRIMEVVAKKLGLSMDQVIANIDEYGNTSAGSMPLALDEAVKSGRVKDGDVIAFAGFGAGLSWGASIVRWGEKN